MTPSQSLPEPALTNGLYYLVLTDLVSSKAYKQKWGNEAGTARVFDFHAAAQQALLNTQPNNSGVFIKTVGDAVLLVFRHFPDIVHWHLEFLGTSDPTGGGPDVQMKARTWVHVGELLFRPREVYGLAVDELFKIEAKAKSSILAADFVLTQAASQTATPSLYPKQCELIRTSVMNLPELPRIELFRLDVKSDIAFVVSKRRADEASTP